MTKFEIINNLKKEYDGCCKCALSETRTKMVHGTGNPNCDLMIIGQSPEQEEDLLGLPFQGAAGQNLDAILEEVGISRDSCWVTNSLLCLVKPGIEPEFGWLEACKDRLFSEIKAINPLVVITLGKSSLFSVVGFHNTIWSHRKVKAIRGTTINHIGTYHLAYPLYIMNKDEQRAANAVQNIIDDFKKAKDFIDEYYFFNLLEDK